MKGLELPINVLVVVAVAVIVLLGVVGLFFAGFIGGQSTITLTSAKNNACAALIQRNCLETSTREIPVSFDANGDGNVIFNNTNGDNLQILCEERFGVSSGDIATCKRNVCACPGL